MTTEHCKVLDETIKYNQGKFDFTAQLERFCARNTEYFDLFGRFSSSSQKVSPSSLQFGIELQSIISSPVDQSNGFKKSTGEKGVVHPNLETVLHFIRRYSISVAGTCTDTTDAQYAA